MFEMDGYRYQVDLSFVALFLVLTRTKLNGHRRWLLAHIMGLLAYPLIFLEITRQSIWGRAGVSAILNPALHSDPALFMVTPLLPF